MSIEIVVLAAGKGSRMKSHLPKVLQPLAGSPLLQHVINASRQLDDAPLHIIIGHQAERVKATINDATINWVEQTEQLGTGHAVMQALPHLQSDSIAILLVGDVPLIQPQTLSALVEQASAQSMALLTIDVENPFGLGRIVRNDAGQVVRIVEQKDADEATQAIREINTGIMAVHTSHLQKLLPLLSDNNAQGEYYLTDIIGLCVEHAISINAVKTDDEIEVLGVNDKIQLSRLERAYQQRQAEALMAAGVTMADPARFDLRGTLKVGQDVFIDVNVVVQGDVELGDGVTIGANSIIGVPGSRVVIQSNVDIKANSIIEEGNIADGCVIGPFARLRPGTSLGEGAKIGNFVETKKAQIAAGAKVNHLTYVGDAIIGEKANIGAGTITCNYDGVNKFTTEIGDNAFIGSNSSLVAPVKIGAGATVGAGSTVTQDVEDGALAVARGRQRNIPNWPKPVKVKR